MHEKQKKTFYVTTPIYYVSGFPHIGTAYTTIAGDVLARWHTLLGKKVFFLTGTDEHGQKVADAAAKNNQKPKDFVDSLVPAFKALWKALNISHDRFIRTTDEDHVKEVQHFITLVNEKGDIYKGEYEGWYCIPCETFYTDLQLVEGNCPTCNRPVKKLKEESYFFRLSNYQDKLLKYYEEYPEFIKPEFRRKEIIARVKDGLKDLSISRKNLSWGIPFPIDTTHSTYVWFDALTNYLTGVGYPTNQEQFDTFWPADIHLVGKEIQWFHAVIWPAMLMSANLPIPKQVFSHGWLTVDKRKMSKSFGNVVDPVPLCQKYGEDPVRFFLLKEIPFGQDGNFSENDLIERNNAELADDLGNLLKRVGTFIEKHNEGAIPKITENDLTEADHTLVKASHIHEKVTDALTRCAFHEALETIWEFVRALNKYFQEQKPWTLKEEKEGDENKKRRNTILYCTVEGLRICALHLAPFIPRSAEAIYTQLGQKQAITQAPQQFTFTYTTTGAVSTKEALFKKYEKESDPLAQFQLKAGTITAVHNHPDAEKLYVLDVDIGNEKRQIVSGIKDWYKPEDLQGKRLVLVANLKYAKLRGVESQGMLLAGEKDGLVQLVDPGTAPNGDLITLPNLIHTPKQRTINDVLALKLTVAGGKLIYKGRELQTSTGPVTCPVGDGAEVR